MFRSVSFFKQFSLFLLVSLCFTIILLIYVSLAVSPCVVVSVSLCLAFLTVSPWFFLVLPYSLCFTERRCVSIFVTLCCCVFLSGGVNQRVTKREVGEREAGRELPSGGFPSSPKDGREVGRGVGEGYSLVSNKRGGTLVFFFLVPGLAIATGFRVATVVRTKTKTQA